MNGWMANIVGFSRDVIEHFGLQGLFALTALDQIALPVPVDALIPLGIVAKLSPAAVILMVVLGALAGATGGYFVGKYLGHPAAVWLFGKEKVDRAEAFIRKWGFFAVILSGLIPAFPFKAVILLCGVFEMPFWRFMGSILLGQVPRYVATGLFSLFVIKTKFYASINMSAVILGALQGVTEFLPISSSGHLILMEQFLKLPLSATHLESFDIILHGGSLLAIVIYFWRDWMTVLKDFAGMVRARRFLPHSLAGKLTLATLPAIAGALLFKTLLTGTLRTPLAVATSFAVSACFFLWLEARRHTEHEAEVSLKKALLIGGAQMLALDPGTSRSGATIGVGMLLGLKRETAARFSFMLGGIALLAANVYTLISVSRGAELPGLSFTLIGFLTSFSFSLASIAWLIRYLKHHSLRPFAFYLLLVSVITFSVLS